MQPELISMLGIRLDELVRADFVVALGERFSAELIYDTFHVILPKAGIEFTAPLDGRVSSIHLFAEGVQGHGQFPGVLPEGLRFGEARIRVHEQLGEPQALGGGGTNPFLGLIPCWDRYDRHSHALHIQYEDELVHLVTLMRPDAVP